MTIEGDYTPVRPPGDRVPGLAGAPLADHAQRRRGRRGGPRQADLLLPRPPRPLAGADRRRLERARRRGDRRLHRRPGVVVGRARDRHRAPRPDRRLRRRHGQGGGQVRRALPRRHEHHRARRLRQRLGRHGAARSPRRSAPSCGACAWTPPSSSSTARCWTRWAASRRPASTRGWSRRSAARWTAPAMPRVKIVASGGFDCRAHPRVRGRRRAGRRLRGRVLADPRRERLHRRRRDCSTDSRARRSDGPTHRIRGCRGFSNLPFPADDTG